jgi:hypothetical protein
MKGTSTASPNPIYHTFASEKKRRKKRRKKGCATKYVLFMEINLYLGDRILIRYLKYYGDKCFLEVCNF